MLPDDVREQLPKWRQKLLEILDEIKREETKSNSKVRDNSDLEEVGA
jgi:cation transport regulator ChaB